ncbi:MAG: ParB N-terminal domain-containing protein [Clostridia bacterium]|nr:ParB N-terminal domain-containing protein [Clostridia bacterium]
MSRKKLQTFEDMFGKETLKDEKGQERAGISELDINALIPFKNHPFKLYEGQRLGDMIESIKEYGVIIPIVVRPIDNGKFEILSGHNRVNAAREAGLTEIPSVIKEGLTQEEATLIVTETNLRQRSFSELVHSERATVIATRHEAMKNQGVRSDLFNEIERLSKSDETKDETTCAPLGHKLKTRDKVGEEYNLSKNSIARYLRISKLIKPLQGHIDEGQIPIRAGVDLSYINDKEQHLVLAVTEELSSKIDIKKASQIREASKNKKLTEDIARDIISGKIEKKKKGRLPHFKLKNNIINKFFTPEQKPKEIETVIEKALSLYFNGQMEGELVNEQE